MNELIYIEREVLYSCCLPMSLSCVPMVSEIIKRARFLFEANCKLEIFMYMFDELAQDLYIHPSSFFDRLLFLYSSCYIRIGADIDSYIINKHACSVEMQYKVMVLTSCILLNSVLCLYCANNRCKFKACINGVCPQLQSFS